MATHIEKAATSTGERRGERARLTRCRPAWGRGGRPSAPARSTPQRRVREREKDRARRGAHLLEVVPLKDLARDGLDELALGMLRRPEDESLREESATIGESARRSCRTVRAGCGEEQRGPTTHLSRVDPPLAPNAAHERDELPALAAVALDDAPGERAHDRRVDVVRVGDLGAERAQRRRAQRALSRGGALERVDRDGRGRRRRDGRDARCGRGGRRYGCGRRRRRLEDDLALRRDHGAQGPRAERVRRRRGSRRPGRERDADGRLERGDAGLERHVEERDRRERVEREEGRAEEGAQGGPP